MERFDFIIAGAGPAGSMAALVLSRAGRKVLVLERTCFPRGKVCGDSLNPRVQALWEKYGLADRFEQLPHFDVAGFTLERQGVSLLRHPFRGPGTRTMDRATLDAWLAEEAQASGATYRFGVAVQGLTATHVQTSDGEFAAPFVIGADGRNSTVGRLGALAQASPPCGRVGWQGFFESPVHDDFVHMNIFPEGYYGTNRVDDARITVTMTLFTACKVTPEQIFQRYFPGIPLPVWRSIHPLSRKPWTVTDGRCWLVGDAARVLEPMTGEGIYSALATAEMAAEQLLAVERIGVKAAARHYRAQHRRFYRWQLPVNSAIRWVMEDPGRSMRVINSLQRWPAAVAPVVDWIHRSPSARPA